MKTIDIAIVGAGPCGLACAIEAKKNGLSHLVFDKGTIAESIRRYPLQMRFFSTRENIEIGDLPFAIREPKASREEALTYYRKAAHHYGLNLSLQDKVLEVTPQEEGGFMVKSEHQTVLAKNVVMATGYFDNLKSLEAKGEDLPHVKRRYREPYEFAFSKVVIVGGGNSAVEAALDLQRNDVDVTLAVRSDSFKITAKYWLVPDLQNRINEGKIKLIPNCKVSEIRKKDLTLTHNDGSETVLEADYVLGLIGHLPDFEFLKRCGVHCDEDSGETVHDKETFQTSVPGIYVAGTVLCGSKTEKIFIENGREHGKAIVRHILQKGL
ncbi:pyridine nucleotide-disulfide oxidoreductase [Fulvitalea axinellae]|uniref:Pyridine nucleotide-disulfide oxidoreductase n=1 Tax=Fulvitalea axinellae TaxID=1182444 RepID=A0AAU9D2W2_9BACT|nr:pyridine nucleotide-disulfide oxidoreductase [Fulvitalea axinellae]